MRLCCAKSDNSARKSITKAAAYAVQSLRKFEDTRVVHDDFKKHLQYSLTVLKYPSTADQPSRTTFLGGIASPSCSHESQPTQAETGGLSRSETGIGIPNLRNDTSKKVSLGKIHATKRQKAATETFGMRNEDHGVSKSP